MESFRKILETFSACTAYDPTRDLAPVGNEDLVKRLLLHEARGNILI